MSASDAQSGRVHPSTRRRTVRIVKQRTASRPAVISLLIAVALALLLPLAWRYWRPEEPPPPLQRTLVDVELEWKCPVGHSFRAAGQVGGRACWTCDRTAFPVTDYTCRVHGPFEVQVRFAVGDDGVPRMASLRWPGEEWVSAEDGLPCPRCSRRLVYLKADPLGRASREAKRVGG